ncbi:NHL domain-containing protein [Paenibacillus chitinolyticus]
MVRVLAFLLITSLVPELNGGKAYAASSFIISTVAGSSSKFEYGGDGGPATSAQLSYPNGVALDSSGNMYIADTLNSRIRKVELSGKMSTIAGTGVTEYGGDGGDAASARLNHPIGVAVDSSGNMYIADTYNHRIRKVDASGKISTVAGKGFSGYGGDGGAATSARLHTPYGVALDSSGNMYIADTLNNLIRKVDVSGKISTIAGTGVAGYGGDGGAATSAQLNMPTEVAVDSSGNMYIADYDNHRIRKVDPSGKISTVAGTGVAGYGGDGGAATSAQLNRPTGVAVDSSRNMYIADTLNNRIRKVDSSGKISTITGTGVQGFSGDGGPATFAQLNSAFGVTVDSSGDLYIADSLNNRIRKLSGQTVIASAETSRPGVGVNNAITLTVKNSLGNTDTSFNGAHDVTISGYLQAPDNSYGRLDGMALSVSSSTASVTFASGVATVNLKLNKAAAQTIILSVADVAMPVANALIITPKAGKADSMSLTTDIAAPASIGGTFVNQPVLTLLDVYGNTSTDDNNTVVTVSKKDTGAWTLTGTATATASAGVVTFIDLGATNAAEVKGAQLTFEALGMTPIESKTVTLPRPQDSSVDPISGTFDKNPANQADVTTTVRLNGNALVSLKNGSDELAQGDYTLLGEMLTIKKEYLARQAVRTLTLTFTFSAGTPQTLVIPIVDTTPWSPEAPVLKNPVAGDEKVTLSWNSVVGATGYKIYISQTSGHYGKEVATVGSSVYGHEVTGLTNGTTYYFVVKATNPGGDDSAASNEVSVTPQRPEPGTEAPTWPKGSALTVSDITQTSVKLSWPSATDNVGVAGYRIYVNDTERETVSGSVYVATIDSLTADTTYTFKIMAYDAAGNESKALTASAKTLPQSPDPDTEAPVWPGGSELTVSDITQTSVKLSWPAAQDHVFVIGYRLYVNDEKKVDQVSSKYEYSVTDNVYSYTMTSLVPGTNYPFTIKAYDAANNESDPGLSKTSTTLPRSSSGDGDSDGSSRGGGWYLSSNASLKSLEIWAGGKRFSLTPSFIEDTFLYTAQTEAKQIEVRAAAAHPAAKVIWQDKAFSDGIQIELEEGKNVIPLIVTAEDGSRKTYTITIERKTPESEKAKPPVTTFTDIAGHWAESYIKRATAKGIISGYPDGTFKPNHPITRAEFMVMLTGALQLEEKGAKVTFTDNDQIGTWAQQAIVQGVQAGIINGYEDGSFRPHAQITRVEMAIMVARALKLSFKANTLTGFADDEAIPQWAKGSVEAIRALGIASGREGNKFVPEDTAMRAEAAALLLRMLETPK